MLVHVNIRSFTGELVHSYVMDYSDRNQVRVFAEQARNALEAGQAVTTSPFEEFCDYDAEDAEEVDELPF